MPLRADIDSLLLYDPSRARTTVNVWVAPPPADPVSTPGKIFLLSAIDTAAPVNHDIITIIQDELRGAFYRPDVQTLERRFVEALQAANRHLHSLIADGVNEWLPRAHFLAGAIQGDHLIMAPVRAVHAFRVQGSRLEDILGIPDDQTPNPLRFFSETAQGQLVAGDRILLCLPSLLDYFSLEKIRRTVLDHAPADAMRSFEQALVDVDPSMSFGALVVAMSEEPDHIMDIPALVRPAAPAMMHSPASPQRSMDDLISTERSTERILAPSIWPLFRQIGAAIAFGIRDLTHRIVSRRPTRRVKSSETSQPVVTHEAVEAAQAWSQVARHRAGYSLVSGWRQVKQLAMRARRPATPQQLKEHIPVVRVSVLTRFALWWRRTTRNQRLIGAGVLIVLIVLTSLLSRNGSTPSTNGTTATASEVETEITRATAALQYGGESIAHEALAAARSKLLTLPTKSKAQKDTADRLNRELAAVESQLAHRLTLPEPTVLTRIANPLNFHAQRLILSGSSLVASDPSTNAIVKIALSDGTTTIATPTLDIGKITAVVPTATGITASTDRPGFAELSGANAWKPLDASFPTDKPTIVALAPFQSRIYALDTTKGRILRFTRAGGSYGTGTNWLKESADLSQAKDIAVDGSVFVLFSTGRVDEYFGGRKNTFAIASMDPPLTQADALWTSADSTSLYILDAAAHRIIVVDKHGVLRNQLTANAWTDMRAMAVDEKNKTLYVMNGDSILRSSLP